MVLRGALLPLLLLSACATGAGSRGAGRGGATASRPTAAPYPPAHYLDAHFAAVTVTKDVPYDTVPQRTYGQSGTQPLTLTLDVYEPTGDTSRARPVIVWIHGGGFRQDSYKTQNYIVGYATEFAKRGYVSMSIEYRRAFKSGDRHADADVPGTPEYAALQDGARDARSALAFIRTHAALYRIDPRAIFVAGGSAGGRIAQTVSQFPGPDGDARLAPDVGRASQWSRAGIVANATLWGAPEVPMRGWVYPYLTAANRTQIVPSLLVHGTADSTISVQHSKDLHATIQAVGGTSVLQLIEGAAHTPTADRRIVPWIATFFAEQWTKALASAPRDSSGAIR